MVLVPHGLPTDLVVEEYTFLVLVPEVVATYSVVEEEYPLVPVLDTFLVVVEEYPLALVETFLVFAPKTVTTDFELFGKEALS